MIRITETIQSALTEVVAVVGQSGGEVIYRGCDDISGRIQPERMDLLFQIIRLFKDRTGFSATIGVGDSLHEAYLALRFAKCRGKGQLHLWNHRGARVPEIIDKTKP
jgi:hypothetical protein